MECDYCNTHMELTTVKVKRPVPDGAKDLNLQDDVTCWKCPKCGKTSEEGLIACDKCGQVTVQCVYYEMIKNIPTNIPVSIMTLEIKDEEGIMRNYECLNCATCVHCNQPLKDRDIVRMQVPRDVDDEGHYMASQLYVHKRCEQACKEKWSNADSGNKSENKGCFIATAAMGSPLSQEVLILSRVRDEFLLRKLIGKWFIKTYYFISPCIATFISKDLRRQKIVSEYFIKPLAKIISKVIA